MDRPGGYYHWRVAQQGLLHLVPHLQGQPTPRTPNARPSGQPLPPRLARTETPAAGASGELQFEDVVTQVLKENRRHIEKKRTNVASSLQKCNNRRTKLRTEFDAMTQAMEVVTDAPSSREMEHRLSSLQTSLDVVERSIMRYENLIEDCRMQEEEAHLEEEISHEQEEEEVTNAEMVDEEERGDPEPSGPCGEADTEGPPPLDPIGDAVSPEEDAFLM